MTAGVKWEAVYDADGWMGPELSGRSLPNDPTAPPGEPRKFTALARAPESFTGDATAEGRKRLELTFVDDDKSDIGADGAISGIKPGERHDLTPIGPLEVFGTGEVEFKQVLPK